MKHASSEEKLELAISYILIGGVLVSIAIEAFGIASYYSMNANLDIVFQPSFAMTGRDFFSYTGILIQRLFAGAWAPTMMLALGIVLLMLTPYLRVLASVIYFGLSKNPKYLFITFFVLVVLTASLLVH